jgi:dTDP-L-rhamnose 4-epimerase
VRDRASVASAVRGIDGVFHLAAEVGVDQSMYEVALRVGERPRHGGALRGAAPCRRHPGRRRLFHEHFRRGALPQCGRLVDRGRHPHSRRPARRALGTAQSRRCRTRASAYPREQAARPRLGLCANEVCAGAPDARAGARQDIEAVALRLLNVVGPGQALSNPTPASLRSSRAACSTTSHRSSTVARLRERVRRCPRLPPCHGDPRDRPRCAQHRERLAAACSPMPARPR